MFFQVVFWNIPCERQSHRLRKAFFRAILRQEIAWFDKHQSGELTSRLAEYVGLVHYFHFHSFIFLIDCMACLNMYWCVAHGGT